MFILIRHTSALCVSVGLVIVCSTAAAVSRFGEGTRVVTVREVRGCSRRVGMPSAVWTVEMATGLRNISQCLEKVPTKSSPYWTFSLNRHLIPTSGHKFLMLVQKDYNRQVVWLSKIKDPKSLLWFLQQGEGHNGLLQILWNFAKSRWQL